GAGYCAFRWQQECKASAAEYNMICGTATLRRAHSNEKALTLHFGEGCVEWSEYCRDNPEDQHTHDHGKRRLDHAHQSVHCIVYFAVIEEVDVLERVVHVTAVLTYLEHTDDEVRKLVGQAE